MESTNFIDAFAIVQARIRCTIIPIDLAFWPGESFHTFAFVFIRIGRHFANAAVHAWFGLAQRMHADFALAVDASVTRCARTTIVAAIVFCATGAVFTRL